MEERKNTSQEGMKEGVCGPMCMCGCGCGWPRGHRMFRVILGLIILALVFWVGVKVGEFKTMIERNSAYGFGGYSAGYYPEGGMMRFVNGGYPQAQTQTQQAPMMQVNGTSTSGSPVQQ